LTEDERDWTGWEQIRLVVYAETTRDALPRLPLGIAVSTGEQNANWGRECEGLRKDEWSEFIFDLADLPLPDQIRSFSLYISDSEYRHGDTVTFSISRLELMRYRKPTLIGFQPLAKIAFADEPVLGLTVDMLGLAPGATAPIEVLLTRGDGTLAKHATEAAQGTTRIAFPLPQGLAPGSYSLVVSAAGRALSDTVQLVPSPWQKGE
ncbi:MAG: carboxypeptidase-like regulatory domain-containing protein, partial [Armatimonadetes bacterium]|nr:carboxypeptidase-like regulatory domain-containing protein [Armatimonadota bacterium]